MNNRPTVTYYDSHQVVPSNGIYFGPGYATIRRANTRSSGSSGRQGLDVYAAGDQMAQLAGAGFSARVTNHADVSPTSTMCQNALMGSVSTG